MLEKFGAVSYNQPVRGRYYAPHSERWGETFSWYKSQNATTPPSACMGAGARPNYGPTRTESARVVEAH